MTLIDRIILTLLPDLRLRNTEFERQWFQAERQRFITVNRSFFPIAALIYIIHYFFVDIPQNLQPPSLWITYRFSMAGIAILMTFFYNSSHAHRVKHYKLPSLLVLGIYCYFQARTVVWYPQVPYLYGFLFVFGASWLGQLSPLGSTTYAFILFSLQWSSYLSTQENKVMIYSAAGVTLFFILLFRMRQRVDVDYFIANNLQVEAQKKLVELNIEFRQQVMAFLPNEISKRIEYLIQQKHMTILQAIDEVLRPRRRNITCLFTDIRSFTDKSKQVPGFLDRQVIPHLKVCIEHIDDFHGIPRQIGDLIMAYFDHKDFELNLRRSIESAFLILKTTNQNNNLLDESLRIVRFIIITSGQAVVGNIGGIDGSREITALGTPINLASRMDELTKLQNFKDLLDQDSIILSHETGLYLQQLFPAIEMKCVDLKSVSLIIRNFSDQQFLWLVPVTKHNQSIIHSLNSIEGEESNIGDAA